MHETAYRPGGNFESDMFKEITSINKEKLKQQQRKIKKTRTTTPYHPQSDGWGQENEYNFQGYPFDQS